MKTGYESTRERRGLRQELRVYITILEIVAITAILLIGIHTINQLDEVMSQQAIHEKTMADCMDQIMDLRMDLDMDYTIPESPFHEYPNYIPVPEIDDLSDDILQIEDSINEARKDSATLTGATLLGEYEITHYCPCSACCGKWADGITATGTTAKPNHTIAVDPEVIPYGTEVIIDGIIYIAEDCGGAIKQNRIDIFVSDHQEAINRGRITREVYQCIETE